MTNVRVCRNSIFNIWRLTYIKWYSFVDVVKQKRQQNILLRFIEIHRNKNEPIFETQFVWISRYQAFDYSSRFANWFLT